MSRNKTVNVTRVQQLELESGITKYNRSLITLNNINTPVICEDLIRRGKGKKHKTQQKTIDYRHLLDGCHPSAEITKLWLLKFIKLIDRIKRQLMQSEKKTYYKTNHTPL